MSHGDRSDARNGNASIDDAPIDDPTEESDADLRSESAGRDERPHLSTIRRQETPYTESQVIMTTVKVVSPFAFTYGLFVTFHGGGSPGGGFQGGAIIAAVVLMIAFAFGIESTRQWLSNRVVVALAVGGTLVFAGIGLAGVALGGTFLEYALIPFPNPVKWGMEGVEILGITAIVASVLVGLFFLLAAGFADESTSAPTRVMTVADGRRDTGIEGEGRPDSGGTANAGGRREAPDGGAPAEPTEVTDE